MGRSACSRRLFCGSGRAASRRTAARSSQKLRWWSVLAPLAICISSRTVGAEHAPDVLRLAEPKHYFERYLDNPQVSGNLLVGVRWARADENPDAPGKFDPSNVHLILPTRLPARTACVEVNSKDGRYSAENLYAVPPNVGREPALDAKSQFENKLKYNIDNIAVLIRTGSCAATNSGKVIPAVLVPTGTEVSAAISAVPALVVAVNADPGSVELTLRKNGAPELRAVCESAGESVNISYSAVCRFHPDKKLESGEYDLILSVKERFKTVKLPPFKLLVSE